MHHSLYAFRISIATCFILSVLIFLTPSVRAQTNCPILPTNTGSVTITITSPATATYKVWSRMIVPSVTDNSFYLQVDDQCAITVGDTQSIPPSNWTWVGHQDGQEANPITLSLSAGSHILRLIGREKGVRVDKVLFTPDLSCIPLGFGDNCAISPTATSIPMTPTPTQNSSSSPTSTQSGPTSADATSPIVTITSPKPNQRVKRTSIVTISATASDLSGINKVEFLVNNVLTCIDTSIPYECKWTVPDRTWQYTLQTVAYDRFGNIGKSNVIRVYSRK